MVGLDPKSLKEWQEKDLEWMRYDYDLKPTDYVIDIGSYRGEWSDKIEKAYGCKPLMFDALNNNAAWIYDGFLEMGGAYYYTSMFEKGNSRYKCVDILDYLDKEVSLMKINIEGGEYLLLDYIIDSGKIGLINNIQVQFHIITDHESELKYKKLAEKLSVTHKLDWQYKFCWENWSLK